MISALGEAGLLLFRRPSTSLWSDVLSYATLIILYRVFAEMAFLFLINSRRIFCLGIASGAGRLSVGSSFPNVAQ